MKHSLHLCHAKILKWKRNYKLQRKNLSYLITMIEVEVTEVVVELTEVAEEVTITTDSIVTIIVMEKMVDTSKLT